jgi:hypothetical protein
MRPLDTGWLTILALSPVSLILHLCRHDCFDALEIPGKRKHCAKLLTSEAS